MPGSRRRRRGRSPVQTASMNAQRIDRRHDPDDESDADDGEDGVRDEEKRFVRSQPTSADLARRRRQHRLLLARTKTIVGASVIALSAPPARCARLNQFMNSDVDEADRRDRPAIVMRITSTAWPVWLSTVPANTETRSG